MGGKVVARIKEKRGISHMSLNLNITKLAGPGRRAKPMEYSVVRPLNEADVEMLQYESGIAPSPVQRITDRHHALARLIAAGTSDSEAALILGYTNSRISILKASPAFAELLALYKGEVNNKFATVLDHMAGLSRDAVLELRERIEETPEKFSNAELLRILTDMADRTAGDPLDDERLPTKIELIAKPLKEYDNGED